MATKKTKVELSAKTSKYEKSMRNVQRINKKTSQTIIGAWKTASVAVVAATAAMGIGFKLAIDAASDLQEVQGKFDVVFAAHKRQAEDMAKGLVDSYAMSSREAKQYMSNVQDLLVPMGMASAKAILMSNEVVKLSADLGSFNNLPTAKVMEDIQSALVGNFETMKKYGVVLNETVIKQKALEMGLYTGKGMVDANTKAQVAYKLMLEGSAAAIGDQKRTMGSYANQMKLLKAQTENISAAIGDKLLPEVTAWVEQLNIMIGQNPQAIDQIGEFAKNMLDLATAMGQVVGFSAEFSNVWVTTWQAMGLASAGVISWTEALTNATAAVEQFENLEAGPKFYDISRPESDQAEIPSGTGTIDYKAIFDAEKIAMEERAVRMTEMREIELEVLGQYYESIEAMALEARDSELELEDEKRRRAGEISAYEIQAAYNTMQRKKQIGMMQLKTGIALGMAGLKFAGVNAKAIFAIQKSLEVGQAVMAAYTASSLALANPPGPPYTIPVAAAALKMGLWNAAFIAATALGSFATSAGSGSYTSPTVTIPAGPSSDVTTPLPAAKTESKPQFVINVEGDLVGDEYWIEKLAEKISDAVENYDVRLIASNAQYADNLT